MKKEVYLKLMKEEADWALIHVDSEHLASFWRGFINGIFTVVIHDLTLRDEAYEEIKKARDEAESVINDWRSRKHEE